MPELRLARRKSMTLVSDLVSHDIVVLDASLLNESNLAIAHHYFKFTLLLSFCVGLHLCVSLIRPSIILLSYVQRSIVKRRVLSAAVLHEYMNI